MVLLVGNYPIDRQQSMQRFARMMLEGLRAAGIPAELIQPPAVFGRVRFAGKFVGKWLGYLDKFVLFPPVLQRRMRNGVELVHICDHSNAMYGSWARPRPVVVTCHDLLAVRGALGEVPDTPASPAGKYLQRWILGGLGQMSAVVCVSNATLRDVQRLVRRKNGVPQLLLISCGLNYPYQKQEPACARRFLAAIPALASGRPFVMHVGSNLRTKNREGVLRIFARTKNDWEGLLVFAGQKLTPATRSLGQALGIDDRVVEVEGPSNEMLEALYSLALGLLFPSRFEGFGAPIIEAQACGCPVICADREPMSDVAGEGGLTAPVEDEAAMAAHLLRLLDPGERARWSERSLRNLERFRTDVMIKSYIDLYRSLGAPV